MKIQFYLQYSTQFGESLSISGDIEELGKNDPNKSLPLNYLNKDYWTVTVHVKRKNIKKGISYKYILYTKEGSQIIEICQDRQIDFFKKETEKIQLVDVWNSNGDYENTFYTSPFKNVLLQNKAPKVSKQNDGKFSHVFKVKAPLLKKDEVVCLIGENEKLGKWSTEKPRLLSKVDDWWIIKLDFTDYFSSVNYKYGVFNVKENEFVCFETGDDRVLHTETNRNKLSILHDGFVHIPNNTWKGAGVAIPVFSLRSNNSFGVGEFSDIKLLVDWSVKAGLKMIQLLPVNDSIAQHNWKDSYPYSAISAFALHPLYIDLNKVAGEDLADQLTSLKKKQKQLNDLYVVDYEEVIKYKLSILRELYDVAGKNCLATEGFKRFFEQSRQWLEVYAAFCYLRDKNNTADFSTWKSNAVFDKNEIAKFLVSRHSAYKEIAFYYFIQYHLHCQLKEAVEYAHKKGVVVKGDIPIGISRNSCDAWEAPELYNMEWQAGAPPDDFTAAGQNWGFPTYNWEKMQENDFNWWRKRFEQMNHYFDAFRIDHILGFFRIWSIPLHATQGIMGRFIPCIPVDIAEFTKNGQWFDLKRLCNPYITDAVLENLFGDLAEKVKKDFLVPNEFDGYDLASGFETQRQVKEYFNVLEFSEENEKIKLGLYELITNVILFEEDNSNGQKFHFRFSMEKTSSYENLMPPARDQLKKLYINYFYERQDDRWKKEAVSKLPQLKAATNMLVCGEDLGMVPNCVPEVMAQLGILSLEIQRMPKNPQTEFFHPNDAPYLSVITPSTHDMSTIRSWWKENAATTQRFYNNEMGQWGTAPVECEAWINKAIVMQHLHSPAMWSVFQIQDLLGMSEKLRKKNADEERINNPANPNHYWQYRMHITLEELIKESDFNEELKNDIENCGRG